MRSSDESVKAPIAINRIHIDKNIPIASRPFRWNEVLSQMREGDSFEAPFKQASSFASAVRYRGGSTVMRTTKKDDDRTTRVWLTGSVAMKTSRMPSTSAATGTATITDV